MSIKKTSQKCSRGYYWPNMHRDIVYWTKCCVACQLRNHPNPRYRSEMLSTPVNTLFAKVGLDLMGPFPITEDGNKHVLNVICWFTKYIISVPVPDAKARTLAHALLTKVYLIYGGCTTLISDQATTFTAEFFREFCQMLYVNKHFATPHWSQGNAATERSFRTYQNILAKYLAKTDRNFDQFLPFATFCYNTTMHTTTRESPYFLMFGRDPIFHVDQIVDPSVRDIPTEYDEFKEKLVKCLIAAWESADECTREAQKNSKEQYDRRVRPNPVYVGDRVLLRDYKYIVGRSRKFHSPYKGIYRVIKVDGIHITIVSTHAPQTDPIQVNINQLKKVNEWVPMGHTMPDLDEEEKEDLVRAKGVEKEGMPGYSHSNKRTLPLPVHPGTKPSTSTTSNTTDNSQQKGTTPTQTTSKAKSAPNRKKPTTTVISLTKG
jgi:Integrase zinc binding domain/Integrase core domain